VIEIVPFAAAHQAGVLDVILPIQQTEFDLPITLADQPDLVDVPRCYRNGHGDFWVALSERDVVGTIALLDIGNRQGALRKMFVRADLRGPSHGVAGRLLATLLAACEERGVDEVYLGTTARFLAAHRFYAKNGFVEVAKTALPAAFPIMAVDTRFFVRRALTAA
jgi:N-acetylglutamate synthase-like GNAT family acetyltransferase